MPLAPLPAGPAAATPPVARAAAPPAVSFGAHLEAQRASSPGARPGPPGAAGTPPLAALERGALASVEAAQHRLDAVLAAARSGKTFTVQDLLALQAQAYRTVQTIDLATRLVEQGAGAVKQAWNTQL